MKTILVPTDFSQNASNALAYAIGLAKKEHAKIILAHAYYDVFVSGEIPAQFLLEQMAQTKKNAEDKLAEIALQVKSENIPCEIMALESRPVDMVLNEAAKIIAKAECPVLAIPEKAVYKAVNTIAFATEYHTSDVAVIKSLSEIAAFFNASITVLHVCLDADAIDADEETLMADFKAKLMQAVAYEKINFKLLYGAEFLETLEIYTDETAPDLMAMSTQPRGLFKSLFHASSTQNFSNHSTIPLLTFHVKDESSGLLA
jgi:nucleotide-binding universal stress UspA family protein